MDHSTNEKMPIYKIAKPILGLIYKIWYNPKIIGKEKIPTTGAFIIVGNHVHLMDQCNVIISTKRKIHYLAKMEYFDPNSSVGKFAWFFRGSGCIPVDRQKKDTEATSMALEVLNNHHALGLFPEGTRNAYKEPKIRELYEESGPENMSFEDFYKKIKKNKATFIEYLIELKNNKFITQDEFNDNLFNIEEFLDDLLLNHRITLDEYVDHYLLPFKFGTVSMAHKTSSVIVPYAITGTYKFRSKDLTVRYGEPFTVGDDLEKANLELQERIKQLIKESLKSSGK
ncbi:MAG: 1-acyl-sn-glycerol-3-phosphate acyltransferase [Bacilli bacterium]|nr:1-acyl-sn-glycerol-3-phosphate acyltransferase [Bacilli bacterium]